MALSQNLSRLVTNFYRDIGLARKLDSMNPQDDLAVRAAVVGFSYNSPTQEWAKGHFEALKKCLDREFPSNLQQDYGMNSENVRLFFALAIGYLLGVYQQGMVSDSEFTVAEKQVSGLVFLHLATLTEDPV